MTNNNLRQSAIDTIAGADFRHTWPIDVRRTLVDAAKTEGEIPAYAVRQVERALRVAQAIEKRLSRDIEIGEGNLSHADKQRLGIA